MVQRIWLVMVLFCLSFSNDLSGQSSTKDSTGWLQHLVHLGHNELFGKGGKKKEAYWDSIHQVKHLKQLSEEESVLRSDVTILGWHPHFMGSAYSSYHYDLLSIVSYFSYKLDPNSGSYKNIYNWKTTGLHDAAKGKAQVLLTVTNFGKEANETFLKNSKAQDRCIKTLIDLLEEKEAHGVTLDFELVPGSMRAQLNNFVQKMRAEFDKKKESKDYLITMAIPSVDFAKAFDVKTLSNSVDLFVIMGYDYYYPGSSTAGPSAPMQSGEIWKPYNLERSIDTYLGAGAPKKKLLLGLPYYGDIWETTSKELGGKTLDGTGKSVLYKDVRKDYGSAYKKAKEESTSKTKYHMWDAHNTGAGHYNQLWFDDAETLAAKYDLINQKGIGGLGIWALGYDNGYEELWELIHQKFSQESGEPIDTAKQKNPPIKPDDPLEPDSLVNKEAEEIKELVKSKLGALASTNTRALLVIILGVLLLLCFLALLVALFYEKLRDILFKTQGRQVAYLLFTLLVGAGFFALLQSFSSLIIALILGIGLGAGLASINQIF